MKKAKFRKVPGTTIKTMVGDRGAADLARAITRIMAKARQK